jgi:hypothetical protein
MSDKQRLPLARVIERSLLFSAVVMRDTIRLTVGWQKSDPKLKSPHKIAKTHTFKQPALQHHSMVKNKQKITVY